MKVSTITLLGFALAAAAFGSGCSKTDYTDSSTDSTAKSGTSQSTSQGNPNYTVPKEAHKDMKTGAAAEAALRAKGIIK